MRILVFFDLPTESYQDKRNYTRFRKFLLKDGFMMLQFSVYTKLAINKTVAQQVCKRIEEHKPPDGNIAVLEVTEKQFASINWIIGAKKDNLLDSTDKITFFDEE
jgi:CRISPR-associated protein Cas2